MKKKYSLLLLTLVCFTVHTPAQFAKISGRVTDFNNNPIPRATISFKGSMTNRTMTDSLGNYVTIRNIETQKTIVCTHANFKTAEQIIENNSILNLRLYPNEDGYVLPIIDDSTSVFDNSADEEKRFIDSFYEKSKDRIFTKVEISPEFNGGKYALMIYYKKRIELAKISLQKDVYGTIVLSFIIKKDGTIDNIRLIKGIQRNLDNTVLKLTEQLPKWKPAMQNGKYCDYNYVLSIPISLKVIKQ